MLHQENHFPAHDGLTLFEQAWLPEAQADAVVVALHGFTEHGGRYTELGERLCGEGYAVYALDLRGHGRSQGEPVFVRSFDEYLADLDVFLEAVGRRQPGKPLFLFGHSMGGTIVALWAAARRGDVRGLVLSAPAVQVGRGVFPILRRVAKWLGRLFPRLRIVRMGTGWLSRDPQVVAQFRNDPLVFHDRFPVRIGAEILRAAAKVPTRAGAIRAPLLILQGTADRVVDPAGADRLEALAGSRDKTLLRYEGLYHDLLHEPEKAQVFADLIGWLDQRRH
ncbi:MAG: lysophospholipase [Pirellulales bacterium]|nr:lysophospholipase [Pirellulales bacterium]